MCDVKTVDMCIHFGQQPTKAFGKSIFLSLEYYYIIGDNPLRVLITFYKTATCIFTECCNLFGPIYIHLTY